VARPINADFGIYAFNNFRTPSAMQYYRILTPLLSIYELGLANIYADDGVSDREAAINILNGADIALTWNLTGPGAARTVESFSSQKPIMKDGALIIPPALVFDNDDAVEYIHPLNEMYSYWGTRDWQGDLLKVGDELHWPQPDGTTKPLWVDKVTRGVNDERWDIERNLKRIEEHYKMAANSHGVTVTNEYLASLYRERGAKNVYVYPNSVREDDYKFPNLMPHEGVRILWQGGSSHGEDWMQIREAFVDTLRQFPEAKLVVWGAIFPWMKRDIAPEQLELHGWSSYCSYKALRPLMDADINLAPLLDSPFNRAKSAIKWYEASLGPRPELTIAGRVGPYLEIEDGQTGFLYSTPEEFAEKLRVAITNAELRQTVAHRSQNWVRANRDAKKTAVGLFEFYSELKRQQRMGALVT